MEKFVVFILAGVGGFFAVSSFGGEESGDFAFSKHMARCERQMSQVFPGGDADAPKVTKACECMYDEFEKKDISLLDAFGSDFEEMSRITRSCAVKNGARMG